MADTGQGTGKLKEGVLMLGAIIGDIVGSRFEFNNHKSKEFELFTDGCFVTDDSIMTLAVAKAIMETEKDIELVPGFNKHEYEYLAVLSRNTITYMQRIGRKYPDCGFGGMFAGWIANENPEPYNSFGNGAAMRVSPAGYAARTQHEAEDFSDCITSVSHNHEEGMKGARATAVAIFMARQGYLKSEIRKRINSDYYALDFCIDDIREGYKFNETCQQTVPQAIECFLESVSFEDAIRLAVSLGGDSDTVAAITGSIAQAYYGIPDAIRDKALCYLNDDLLGIYQEWVEFTGEETSDFNVLTKYISRINMFDAHREMYTGAETHEYLFMWPYEGFVETVNEFRREFHQYIESLPGPGIADYREILMENGIEKVNYSMTIDEAAAMDGQCILAHIMHAIQSENSGDEILPWLFKKGCMSVWLKRLRDIDWHSKPGKLSEISLSIGGYGGYDEHTICFIDENAVMFKNSHFKINEPRKKFSVNETKKLIEDWTAVHTEYWQGEYIPPMPIIDGTNWSLYIKYSGRRGYLITGENEYPGNWEALLGVFGIVDQDEEDEAPIRRPGELIYCSVSFNEHGDEYYYQTEDDELEVGDTVIVPVGESNDERTGVIGRIEYFDPELVPYPLEKTKHIISRAPAGAKKAGNDGEHVIYSGTLNGISTHVWAEIREGCLVICGQDLGVPYEFFDGEYEYFYSFDQENTLLFSELLTRQTEDLSRFLNVLTKKMKGFNWYSELTYYCNLHGLKFNAFSC